MGALIIYGVASMTVEAAEIVQLLFFSEDNHLFMVGFCALQSLAVLCGFVCACISRCGLTPQRKANLLSAITTVELIVLVAYVSVSAVIVINLWGQNNPWDFNKIAAVVLGIYYLFKFATLYGFSEFLKISIKNLKALITYDPFCNFPVSSFQGMDASYTYYYPTINP